MSDTENKKPVKFSNLDGGLFTLYSANNLKENQSPDCQNFDVSDYGQFVTRKGYAKFTPSAKGSPTGTGINGLFAAAQSSSYTDKAWQFKAVGSVFVDVTTAFNTGGTCSPFPATAAVGDIFYVGLVSKFAKLTLNITTPGVGGALTWEYWNGSSWATLVGLVDGSSQLTGSGVVTVVWSIQSNWATTAVNSSTLYWVRARCTTHYTTAPILGTSSLSPGRTHVLAAEGSTVQDITDGTWATAITGLTISLNTRVHMMMYNNKYLIANQGGGPWKTLDGVSAASLGGSPPSAAVGGMVHRSRVWWFPDNSSTATFSGLNSEEDYTSADNAGSIVINNGDGMILNCMASGGLFAVISKIAPSSGNTDGKMYILTGSSTFDFAIQKIADMGALGPDCMIGYDNLVVAATNRGVYAFQIQIPTKLSQNIKPTFDAIASQTALALGKYKTTIRLSYASSSTNDTQLIMDVERGVWGRNSTKPFSRYANHPNGTLLAGSVSSALVYTDDSGTSDDGGAIDCYFLTKMEDFGVTASPKHLAEIDIHSDNTGNFAWTVTHLIDGVDTGYSDTFNPSTEGIVKRMNRTLNKRGKFHQIKIRNNQASQPMAANSITVWAEVFNPGVK